PPRHAPHQHHPGGDHRDHQRRAQVGLHEHQRHGRPGQGAQAQVVEDAADGSLVHRRGQGENEGDLRELAGLEAGQRAEVEPRLGAVHLAPEEVHEDQHPQREDVEVRGEPDDPDLADPQDGRAQDDPAAKERELALELLAARDRAVERGQAHRQHEGRDERQAEVGAGHGGSLTGARPGAPGPGIRSPQAPAKRVRRSSHSPVRARSASADSATASGVGAEPGGADGPAPRGSTPAAGASPGAGTLPAGPAGPALAPAGAPSRGRRDAPAESSETSTRPPSTPYTPGSSQGPPPAAASPRRTDSVVAIAARTLANRAGNAGLSVRSVWLGWKARSSASGPSSRTRTTGVRSAVRAMTRHPAASSGHGSRAGSSPTTASERSAKRSSGCALSKSRITAYVGSSAGAANAT